MFSPRFPESHRSAQAGGTGIPVMSAAWTRTRPEGSPEQETEHVTYPARTLTPT